MAEGSTSHTSYHAPSPRRYWTRRGLAEWLRDELDRDVPTLVGGEGAFHFRWPLREDRLSSDWQGFLEDFHYYWPTDAQHTYVCSSEKTFMAVASGGTESETGLFDGEMDGD